MCAHLSFLSSKKNKQFPKMAKRIFKQDEFKETGFGNRVIESNQRMMNKDGKSNVRRTGLLYYSISNVYHLLISIKWWKFLSIIF